REGAGDWGEVERGGRGARPQLRRPEGHRPLDPLKVVVQEVEADGGPVDIRGEEDGRPAGEGCDRSDRGGAHRASISGPRHLRFAICDWGFDADVDERRALTQAPR